MTDKITCILTLKGREQFTRRFFHYINQIQFPYKLLIGDGDPKSTVESFLQSGMLNAVDYEYLRFNDHTREAYFAKLEALVRHAKTPYVMICDNDDFPLASGMALCGDFLERHPEYVAVGGQMLGVQAVIKNQSVRVVQEKFLYEMEINCVGDSSLTRVINYCQNYTCPCWYHVMRREALLKSLQLFRQSKVTDFLLMELFLAFSLAAQGKIRFDKQFTHYIRQTNSSQLNVAIKDFTYRVIFDHLGVEVLGMLQTLAEQISACEGRPFEEVENALKHALYQQLKAKPAVLSVSQRMKNFLNRYDYSFRYFLSFYHSLRLSRHYTSLLRHYAHLDPGGFAQEYLQMQRTLLQSCDCAVN